MKRPLSLTWDEGPLGAPLFNESKDRATTDRLMTKAEVAAWLQVEPRQLARLGVPALKLGRKTVRYSRTEVQGWLDNQRNNRQTSVT